MTIGRWGLVGLLVTGLSACSSFGRSDTVSSAPVTSVSQEALPPPGTPAGPAPQPAAPPTPAATVPASSTYPALPPPRATPGAVAGISANPQPAPAPQATALAPEAAPPAPAFMPMTPQALIGDWTASDQAGKATCKLALTSQPVAGFQRAAPIGCQSQELTRVTAWQSRGQDIMLLDDRGAPVILLRPAANGRYEGTGLSREAFAIWR